MAAGASRASVTDWLGTMGINDQGNRARMFMPDAEYTNSLAYAGQVSPLSNEAMQAAKDAIAAQEHLTSTEQFEHHDQHRPDADDQQMDGQGLWIC